DVGIDFYKEIAADNHRLGLGVVDVRRDDGSGAGDLGAHKLGGDGIFDFRFSIFDWFGAGMLEAQIDSRFSILDFRLSLAAVIFADGDEFHLGGNDSLAGVPELS